MLLHLSSFIDPSFLNVDMVIFANGYANCVLSACLSRIAPKGLQIYFVIAVRQTEWLLRTKIPSQSGPTIKKQAFCHSYLLEGRIL